MTKVVALGEMMARLMPPGFLRIEQTSNFDIFYGGDESIVATTLARLGLDAFFITKLPDNPLGHASLNHLRAQGVNTKYVLIGGERLGLNFYENGAAIRPSRVLYDRKHSSFASAEPNDFDFEKIFSNAKWFHVSGITPALSNNSRLITQKAVKTAKKMKIPVSVDLNYRRKLWTPEEAKEVMTELMYDVDVCIGNEEDAEIMLGYIPKRTNVHKGIIDVNEYLETFSLMKEKFGFKYIASTLRESHSASDNSWSVLVFNGEDYCQSKKYELHLVDRGGGGASFSAGLIYGFVTGMSLHDATEFSAAISALKQTVVGDFNFVSLNEVMELVEGDISGRVKR